MADYENLIDLFDTEEAWADDEALVDDIAFDYLFPEITFDDIDLSLGGRMTIRGGRGPPDLSII